MVRWTLRQLCNRLFVDTPNRVLLVLTVWLRSVNKSPGPRFLLRRQNNCVYRNANGRRCRNVLRNRCKARPVKLQGAPGRGVTVLSSGLSRSLHLK